MAEQSRLSMPPQLVERARALIAAEASGDATWIPPLVRDAATVIMVRDRPNGLQVYLQRRVRTMAFAAGMYVFPGGAVEPQDLEAATRRITGLDNLSAWTFANRPHDSPGEDNLANRFAAVRETLEETSHDLGDPFDLSYVGHWVTPAVEDRRFDTRFYAANIGDNHHVRENSTESDAQSWLTPADALAQAQAGHMLMLPPTVATLIDFAREADKGASAQEAIDVLARRPIRPLMPSPAADQTTPDGIRWRLIDFRTGAEIARIEGSPAGSESGGVHTSVRSTDE